MISWLQKHMLPCAFKTFFGIDCPICGFQRSFVELLKGQFYESFKIYPPLIFILILILMLPAYLIFPFYIQQKHVRMYAAFVLSVIIVNYLIKILTGNL